MPADGIYLSNDAYAKLQGDLFEQDARGVIADEWHRQVMAALPDMVAQAQQEEAQRQAAAEQQRQQAEQAQRDALADQFEAAAPQIATDHVASLVSADPDLATRLGGAPAPESLQNGPTATLQSQPAQTTTADLNAAPAPAAPEIKPLSPVTASLVNPPTATQQPIAPVQSATQTTAALSGGGDLAGQVGARGQQIMASAADSASWLGQDGQRALQAVLLTEGGLAGARGDQGKSAGPLQFFEGGQLANFAQQHGLSLDQAKAYVEANPEEAVRWAIGTPDAPGYLGRAIQAGLQAGLKGADLATYAQQHGQVSVSPERAGANYNALFGGGAPPIVAAGQAAFQQAARDPNSILNAVKPFLGSSYVWGGKSATTGFDCSGLAGYLTTGQPESTGTLYGKSSAVTPDTAQPGDLVFWNMGSNDPHLQHVGVYLGNGQVVQSGGDQAKVNIGSINQSIGSPPEFRRLGPGGAPAQAVAAPPGAPSPAEPPATAPGQPQQSMWDKLGTGISDVFKNIFGAAGGQAPQTGIPAVDALTGGINLTDPTRSAIGNKPVAPAGSVPTTGQLAGTALMTPAVQDVAFNGPLGATNDVMRAATGVVGGAISDLGQTGVGRFKAENFPSILDPNHPANVLTDPNATDEQRQNALFAVVAGIEGGGISGAETMSLLAKAEQAVAELRARFPQMSEGSLAASGAGQQLAALREAAAQAPVPTLGSEVAATLPPGSGPLAEPASAQESMDTLQGLLQMAKSRGIDTSSFEAQLPKIAPEVEAAVTPLANPFALHTAPGPGLVPLTEEDIASHLENLSTRYETNDARIQELENQLGGGGLGSAGVVHPPGTIGWTNAEVIEYARQNGLNPYSTDGWPQMAGDAAKIAQNKPSLLASARQTPTQARAELTRLMVENDQIMAATDVPEGATTLYRPATQGPAPLPFDAYTGADAGANATSVSANGTVSARPAPASGQTFAAGTNQGGAAASPSIASASAGTQAPLSLKPVATVSTAPPPLPPSVVPASPPPPPPGGVAATVGAVPPSVPTGGANAWDYLRALRIGSLAGGVQTIGHILLNAPLQAAWKLVSDAPLSITRPETIPLEFMGAWQGLRGWATNAATAPLGQPGRIAQSIGGTTGQAVETGLLGLVKTHPVIQDMASQIGTGMELWRQAGIEASNAGLARFSAPWWTEVQNLVANPTANMAAAAQRAGDTFSLRGPMGEVGRAFAGLRGDSKIVDFIMPFFNIGYHVATQGIERSPLGLVGTAIDVARAPLGSGPYAAGALAEGVTPLAQRFRNNMIGTGLAVEAFHQASQGNITGNGPDDPKLKADLLATGWQPDSIRIGGRYFPLHVLGPAGWPLAEAANLYEATHTGEQGGYAKPNADMQSQFASYAGRMAQYGENETFLRSIGQLLQAAGNAKDFGRLGEQEAASVVGSLIPQGALLANAASTVDPYTRRATPGDIGQAIENRLPVLRQGLPLKLTPTGSPVQNPSQGLGVLLPRSTIAAPDPVITAMGQAGVGAPIIPKTIAVTSKYQMDLTPDEQQRFEELRGKALSDQLGDVVIDPDWKSLTQDRQRQLIQRAMTAAADSARKQLLDELPDSQIESRAQLKTDVAAGNRVTVLGGVP